MNDDQNHLSTASSSSSSASSASSSSSSRASSPVAQETTHHRHSHGKRKEKWTDFSISSPIEHFAADIEKHIRKWDLMNGGKGLRVEKDEKDRGVGESEENGVVNSSVITMNERQYELIYYYRDCCTENGDAAAMNVDPSHSHFPSYMLHMLNRERDYPAVSHLLQRWFGVREFLLISPVNGIVPNPSVGAQVLSAVNIALSFCNCRLPCFVPVTEEWRGVYIGTALGEEGVVTRFDTNAVFIDSDRSQMKRLKPIFDLHQAHLGFVPDYDQPTTVSFRLTFERNSVEGENWRGTAVRDAALRPDDVDSSGVERYIWGPTEDPVSCLQVGLWWPELEPDEVRDVQDDISSAPNWFLRSVFNEDNQAILSEALRDLMVACAYTRDLKSLSDLFVSDVVAQTAEAASDMIDQSKSAAAAAEGDDAQQEASNVATAGDGGKSAKRNPRSVREALDRIARITVGSSTSARGVLHGTMKTVTAVSSLTHRLASTLHLDALPTEDQLHAMLVNIFDSPVIDTKLCDSDSFPKCTRLAARGAPIRSPIGGLCMAALSLSNLRSVVLLWRAFVSELRWHWENRAIIPNCDAQIDLNCSLLHQKVTLLNICIEMAQKKEGTVILDGRAAIPPRRQKVKSKSSPATSRSHSTSTSDDEERADSALDLGVPLDDALDGENETDDAETGWGDLSLEIPDADEEEEETTFYDAHSEAGEPDENAERDRELGRLRRTDMKLLNSDAPLYVPVTQSASYQTSDMLFESESMLLRLGEGKDAAETRSRLQSQGLVSDMEAFKAANDCCTLEDFVRWHSPKDYVDGQLSERMSSDGNIWQELWSKAKAVPANKQKQLFKYETEANKILHFFESLTPSELLSAIVATALAIVPLVLQQQCTDASVKALNLPVVVRAIEEKAADITSVLVAYSAEDGSSKFVFEQVEMAQVDEICTVVRSMETALSRATSLCCKFPENRELVETLLEKQESLLRQSSSVRDRVERVFGSSLEDPVWRELIIRTLSARPAYTSDHARQILHRTYALVGQSQYRVATAMSIDESNLM